jgi:hypothetical protein
MAGQRVMSDPLSGTPAEQIQATAAELVDELIRRGMDVKELCRQLDVSPAELQMLLGRP